MVTDTRVDRVPSSIRGDRTPELKGERGHQESHATLHEDLSGLQLLGHDPSNVWHTDGHLKHVQ